ncbi:hypothetical protein BT96DRAFT_917218 [Gymnopus androsaceus JB14]|uniref:Methyltransferase type 11 domain-containing protein n=1 Tax=Gymnopus androsaceus JB14 TaxID=1447944 RepID=A0A6A4I0H4_9AGAR|nr:hypothetical protein BT96DRAFT_917218 [Gymnopus androsaceus JB14]
MAHTSVEIKAIVQQGYDTIAPKVSPVGDSSTNTDASGIYQKTRWSFDAVMGFYSLFHLPREEQGLMMKKMIGWLKPGGWLLFNLGTTEGETVREDWMGAKMYSCGLGIEGNKKMLADYGAGLTDVEDVVDVEYVGRFEERFHWICAKKSL